jgi:hypothetical protein
MDFVSHSISRLFRAPGRIRPHMGTLLLRVSLVFVLFFTLNVQAVFSQDGSPQSPAGPLPVWNPQTIDGPTFFANLTSRALSWRPDGRPCAAFGGDGLYYTCYISPTGWTPVTVIDNSIGVGEYASLSEKYIPYTGEIRSAVTYYDSLNGKLKLVYTIDRVWQPPITVPTPAFLKPVRKIEKGFEPNFEDQVLKLTQPWMSLLKEADPKIVFDTIGVGKYNSVALDNLGAFHISYYDENDASLNYAYWDGATWSFEMLDDYTDIGKGLGMWSSIAVDGYTNVHIAYMDEKYDNLKYAFKNHDGGDWKKVVVDEGGSSPNVGSMISLALDTLNRPYISYLDFSLGNLKVARLVDLHDNSWIIDRIDSSDYTGWYTSIFVDGSNRAHISYYNATRGDLKYAVGKPGGSWSVATLQPTLGNVGLFTSIAWNAAIGRPMILYYYSAAGWMMFIQQATNNRWGTPQIVAGNSRDVGLETSLAVNSDGVPFVSYLDTSYGFLKYTRAVGSTYPKYYPYTKYHTGMFSSIALQKNVTSDDKPKISFYESDNGNLMYGMWTGSFWASKIVDWRYDVGQYNSIALAQSGVSKGAPSISYYDATHQSLMYAYFDVGLTHWFTYTLDDVGEVGKYTSLTVNAANIPYISYYDETNGDLKLKYQTPFHIWAPSVTVDAGGPLNEDVGWYTSIALDNLGNPHISYYDYTNGDLKYAFWEGSVFPAAGGAWNISTLQDVGDVGRFTSLEIYQADNSRHLCYYDYTNKDLMYARFSGGIWEFQTVDNLGDVGLYCSIDLTILGQPAISYYDNSRGDLKLALTYGLPPALYFIPAIMKEP